MTNAISAAKYAHTILGVKAPWVYKLIHQKRLPAIRKGWRWLVEPDAKILPGKRRVLAGDDVTKCRRLIAFGEQREASMLAVAARLNITVSALVRQAVDEYLQRRQA